MPRFTIIFGLLNFILFIVVEPYLYKTIKKVTKEKKYRSLILTLYWSILAISILSVVSLFFYYKKGYTSFDAYGNWMAAYFFANLSSKLFLLLLLLPIEIGTWITGLFRKNKSTSNRRYFLKKAALLTSLLPFSSFLYGTFKGRFQFTVFRKDIGFSDLPSSFDGFRIAHISDVHTGSWDNIEAMQKGLALLQAQQPDIIFFTGDLVNNIAEEATPYIELFKSLSAPYGKYAVMGNHDYGAHYRWATAEDRKQNILDVKAQYERMGFRLLNNENIRLSKDGQQIALLGVENWGKHPFPQVGDLNKAIQGLENEDFKILLSHDPDHWEEHTLKHPQKVHLTLSGHTHGCQMGLDLSKFKVSPVQLRYKRWIDLYQEKEQYLYVNRGFGYIGYPGRIGIWPEIGVLTLKKEV